MPNVINCKKCGSLFLQTSKRDICDKCFDAQNKMINDMNSFVISLKDETISLEALLEKFGMKRSEFEELFAAGKFVKIAKNVTMVCSSCRKTVPILNKTSSLCPECTQKLQNKL